MSASQAQAFPAAPIRTGSVNGRRDRRADLRIPVLTRIRAVSPMFRLKIGILDDYQDVAQSLADWSSLDADVEVFTSSVRGRGRRREAAS